MSLNKAATVLQCNAATIHQHTHSDMTEAREQEPQLSGEDVLRQAVAVYKTRQEGAKSTDTAALPSPSTPLESAAGAPTPSNMETT